ncbi:MULTISPECIES: exodeoxyribonuclease VII large subunit [Prochlorococcus]|uniref:exodeoxyribonuclease VII large subunit n=1 Tax=Prochlorococcus TaxID=1218 RepID=UPI0005338A77|nr:MULTISPECIES: exodeoxyribonuclease VII large subunit [Prochlorococcus]KGG13284.1 Exodeoxyribonuclease VII large subunit [Prochlorococcus sp. MIT 0601]
MDLEPLPTYSVKELNHAIGSLIARGFAPRFNLVATVSKSQLKNGHLWLTLTDGEASITGVIWASTLKKVSFQPNEQDGIEIFGRLNFWENRASLVVQVIAIRPTLSTVLKKFEVVRDLLIKEGLIDEARRRKLPKYPKNIAILTSVPSSALADILRTAKERWPASKVFIFPIPVQGDVSKKIKLVIERVINHQKKFKIEAIVLARGGGSREDLMIFDDEELCRSLANLPVPLITGLGHEDDLTVADLVADHRSATPTAAIVDLLPSREIAKEYCLQIRKRCDGYFVWALNKEKQKLLERKFQWNKESPLKTIKSIRKDLDTRKQILKTLSLESILKRGFCIITNQSGETIRNCMNVKLNEKLTLELMDGYIETKVEDVQLNRNL